MSEFVLDFFEGKNLATIEKKKHSYLMIDGHDQADIYILKDGIVKTSIILSDGREFNIMYLKGFDMLSLLKDEIKKVTSANVIKLRNGIFEGNTKNVLLFFFRKFEFFC